MKLQHICMAFIITSTLFFFASCSLMTLSFSMISTDGNKSDSENESATNSRIVNLALVLTTDTEGTIISWSDYKIDTTDNNKPIYENYYEILRSYKNPWEDFENIGHQKDSPNKEKRTRLSYIDKDITTASPPVWYRINFSYSKKSGDEYITNVILSEAVGNFAIVESKKNMP